MTGEGTFLTRWLANLRPPLTRSASSPFGSPPRRREDRPESPATSQYASPLTPSSEAGPASPPLAGPSSSPPLARVRQASHDTDTTQGSLKSKMRLKKPIFRRRSAASGLSNETRSFSSLANLASPPLTQVDSKDRTAASTPLGRPDRGGPFSPPLPSSTPTVAQSGFADAPEYFNRLPSDFDVARALASLLVAPAALSLQQLAPMPASIPSRADGRSSVATSATTEAPPMDPTSSQTSLPESGAGAPSFTSSTAAGRSFATTASTTTSSVFSGEQLAASTLAVPATSFASLLRTFRNLEWLVDHASVLRSLATSLQIGDETRPQIDDEAFNVFDMCGMLQAVADSVAATAGQKGIDIVIYHGVNPANGSPSVSEQKHMAASLNEVFVRGDERAMMLMLTATLVEVALDTQPGSSIEIGLQATLSSAGSSGGHGGDDTASLAESTDGSTLGDQRIMRTWEITLEVVRTNPGPTLASSALPEAVAAIQCMVATLTRYCGFETSIAERSDRLHRVTRKLRTTLPEGRRPQRRPTARRSSVVEINREPARTELIRFAETALRGKKVVFHASERSVFAKHVTNYFASWGTDISHSAIEAGEEGEMSPVNTSPVVSTNESGSAPTVRATLGRYDSGFASEGSGNSAPLLSPLEPTPSGSSQTSVSRSPPPDHSAIDPSVSFIVIDDDVPTLKRTLTAVRNNPPIQPHFHSSQLLSKRPQLQSRRTRSSAAIRPAGQMGSSLSIVHFTSLTNFRTIREVVRGILRTASPLFPLPDVLVIPKPVGPRRLLTVLYTAIKRPSLDPSFAPIATSPASPGGHYFFSGAGGSPRASPAATNSHQDFDTAAGAALAERAESEPEQATPTSPNLSLGSRARPPSVASHPSNAPRTPPFILPPASTNSTSTLAPSAAGGSNAGATTPLRTEALEYFSTTAAALGAGSASGGIVIQSPDGKPTGLFFQPTKGTRSASGTLLTRERENSLALSDRSDRGRAGSIAMQRNDAQAAAEAGSAAQPDKSREGETSTTDSGGADDTDPSSRESHEDSNEDLVNLPPVRGQDSSFVSLGDEKLNSSDAPAPSPTSSEHERDAAAVDQLGLVTPQHLGLGAVGRAASDPLAHPTASSSSQHSPASPPLHAVRLDSYTLGAPSDPPALNRLPSAPAAVYSGSISQSPPPPPPPLVTHPSVSPPQSPPRNLTPTANRASPTIVASRDRATPPSPAPGTPVPSAAPAQTTVPPAAATPATPATDTGSTTSTPALATSTPVSPAKAALAAKARRRSGTGRVSDGSGSGKKGKQSRRGTVSTRLANPLVPPINVLIVEDNRINQTILSTFLKRRGIRFGIANNGQEAVDMWKTGGFHLVLMDIQLPIKSGIEATSEIRELERLHNIGAFTGTPTSETGLPSPWSPSISPSGSSAVSSPYGLPVIIVALTASALAADRLAALAAGCNDFITKPVSLPWLQQKLTEWGSMQLLAGFPRRTIGRATPGGTPALIPRGTAAQFDLAARNVASRLHIDPRRPGASVQPAAGGGSKQARAPSVEDVLAQGRRLLNASGRSVAGDSIQQVILGATSVVEEPSPPAEEVPPPGP